MTPHMSKPIVLGRRRVDIGRNSEEYPHAEVRSRKVQISMSRD
jgi:hypothetical protein